VRSFSVAWQYISSLRFGSIQDISSASRLAYVQGYTTKLLLRLSDEEFERLKDYAESKQVSPAQVLRDYIKRLPKPKTEGD
jgi:hypothetical protein